MNKGKERRKEGVRMRMKGEGRNKESNEGRNEGRTKGTNRRQERKEGRKEGPNKYVDQYSLTSYYTHYKWMRNCRLDM